MSNTAGAAAVATISGVAARAIGVEAHVYRVHIRATPEKRWMPGHCLWVHGVLAFRGSPAAWKEGLSWLAEASTRQASTAEREKLHRVGDEPIIATMTLTRGETIEFAAQPEHENTPSWSFAAGAPAVEAVAT